MMTCNECRHFLPTDDASGQCRLNPPQLLILGSEPISLYPTVQADDWCGQLEPIPLSLDEFAAARIPYVPMSNP